MNKKVILGFNGSPDSLTAAYLLKKQKFQISAVGVLFSHSNDEDGISYPEIYPNYTIQNVSKVKAQCKKLDIPFHLVDAREQYKTDIIDHLISARLKGVCFDVPLEITRLLIKVLFEKMIDLRGELITTGHFAKIVHSVAHNQFFVKSTSPTESDQSHLLVKVSNFHKTKLYLPFAEMQKKEVSKIFSQKFKSSEVRSGAPSKQSSFTDFSSYLPTKMIKNIDIINAFEDTTIASVEGIHNIELGQNKIQDQEDSTIYSDKNSIIAKIVPEKNCAYIVKTKDLSFDACSVFQLSIISSVNQSKPINAFVKFQNQNIRYKGRLILRNNGYALVRFEERLDIQAFSGQTLVFYDSKKPKAMVIGFAEIATKGIFKGNYIKELPSPSLDLSQEEYNENNTFTF